MQRFENGSENADGSARPEPAASAREEAGHKKSKKGTAVATIVVILIVGGGGTWAVTRLGTKDSAVVKTKGGDGSDGVDADTKAAIAMIQTSGASGPGTGVATTAAPPSSEGAATDVASAPYTATVVETAALEPEPEPRKDDPETSRPNPQRSIRFAAPIDPRAIELDAEAVPAGYKRSMAAGGPVKPPFNSVVPLRSLGLLRTVRSGGLARFEITRDVAGDGWALKKGTQVVGVVRGGEVDRAYVSVVGFIDPASNKLVKLGGDILSSDGGSGLKGKRRKVGSGWGRALGSFARGAGRIVNGVTQVAVGNAVGNVVGGGGLRPVIIGDASSAGVYSLPYDLSGTARDSSFIEVKAGTTAYLLVTELPDTIKGVDAVTEMRPEEIAEYADANHVDPALGISEEELSRLMSEGSPDAIRAALPRMTPELRRIAERVLGESGN